MGNNTHNAKEEFIEAEPLVSFVIPVYNVRRYLPQCLESVISQTYKNLEIMVIDDGSTDNSGNICDEYSKKDSRIHVIHSINRGLSAARNLALDNITGKYVFFLDSDDWIDSKAIDTLVRTAILTDADIVVTSFCAEYVGKTIHSVTEKKDPLVYRGQDILPAFVEGAFDNVVWNKLYSSDCFKTVRFPSGRNFEDVAVTWQLMKNLAENGGTVTVLSEEHVHFRKRKSSISNSWSLKNIKDSWKSFTDKYRALPDYQDKLITECFVSIKRMWMSYSTFSKEEKVAAKTTIRDMQAFSKKNFSKIMKGHYSKVTKMTCLISQNSTAPVMGIGFIVGKLRFGVSDKKYVKFN